MSLPGPFFVRDALADRSVRLELESRDEFIECVNLNRLDQVVIEARQFSLALDFDAGVARKHHELRLAGPRLLSQPPSDLVPIHARQADVQDDQFGPIDFRRREDLERVMDGADIVSDQGRSMARLSAASRLSSTTRIRLRGPIACGSSISRESSDISPLRAFRESDVGTIASLTSHLDFRAWWCANCGAWSQARKWGSPIRRSWLPGPKPPPPASPRENADDKHEGHVVQEVGSSSRQ